MLKISDYCTIHLAHIAVDHFRYLNKKYKSGNKKNQYQKTSIIKQIEVALQNSTTSIEKQYYQFLLGNKYATICKILLGKPYILEKIVNEFNQKFPSNLFRVIDPKTHKLVETKIGKETKKIFNYRSFRKSPFCIQNLIKLGFEKRIPCPYCNFDELGIIIKKDKKSKQALLVLDHFFSQAKYPFLALSFYNLIPSCDNCNSNFKGEKVFLINTHINPYYKSFEDTFIFSLETPFYIGMNIANFNFLYKNAKNISFPYQSISDLSLIERYNSAKDLIYDKIATISKHTINKEKEIADLFDVTNIDNDMYRMAEMPIQKKDIIKFKLGKLKRDICIDNGLL